MTSNFDKAMCRLRQISFWNNKQALNITSGIRNLTSKIWPKEQVNNGIGLQGCYSQGRHQNTIYSNEKYEQQVIMEDYLQNCWLIYKQILPADLVHILLLKQSI